MDQIAVEEFTDDLQSEIRRLLSIEREDVEGQLDFAELPVWQHARHCKEPEASKLRCGETEQA